MYIYIYIYMCVCVYVYIYVCITIQGKLMMQSCENSKNPNFRPNLGPQNLFFMGFISTSS